MLAINEPNSRTITPIQLREGVRSAPPMGYTVRIIQQTILRKEISRNAANQPKYKGEIVYPGTVVDVLPEDWMQLRDSGRAVIVPSDTPRVTVPAPVDPNAREYQPKRFVEMVEAGLNTLNDLALALNTTKLEIARLAKQAIADGLVSVNDRGVYLRTAKKVVQA